MPKPLAIYCASHYYHEVSAGLPALKPVVQSVCGRKIRRIDRFTQLALIGSFGCRPEEGLGQKTGVYLSSIYGSLGSTASVLSDMYRQGQLPKPFSFINTVSNTACFYLAQQLGLSASNQFVTSADFTLEAGLKLATIDLELGRVEGALVGVVCEVDDNLKAHRQRLQLDARYQLAEGSHWLYLSHERDDRLPLARLTAMAQPLSMAALKHLLKLQLSSTDLKVSVGFSAALTAIDRAAILADCTMAVADYMPAGFRHECPTALQLQGFLAGDSSAERFIAIDKNASQQYSVIALEKPPAA